MVFDRNDFTIVEYIKEIKNKRQHIELEDTQGHVSNIIENPNQYFKRITRSSDHTF